MFNAPELLKHRILLALIYSAGLRAREASRLRIADIDSGRMMIHIRQSKYNKDRYVPLSLMVLEGLRKYYYCEKCGYIRISYNSCRNRHCPKCQNTHREVWIENRKQDLLPVPYFHVVFTVPDKLNSLFLQHPVILYNVLFASAWETIAQFSYTKLHAETGMVAILHTWGQNLSVHPHVHCVVPGGGINFKGQWKQVSTSDNGKVFLFRVENLSKVFRTKFIDRLNNKLPQDRSFNRDLYKIDWVVYSKELFAGTEQVIEYLGRYTHKTAISNHRLLNIDQTGVKFTWRDYRDNTVKVMTLEGTEFLRRFCQHILPGRFVRIRHYGLLYTARRDELRELQQAFGINTPEVREKKHWKDVCREHLNYDPDICPQCGKGHMSTIELFFGPHPPPLTVTALNEFLVK